MALHTSRSFAVSKLSDTPQGRKPHGFSGYACGNPLRWRLKAVSPPTVRIPGPRSRYLSSRTEVFSHKRAEPATAEDFRLKPHG